MPLRRGGDIFNAPLHCANHVPAIDGIPRRMLENPVLDDVAQGAYELMRCRADSHLPMPE